MTTTTATGTRSTTTTAAAAATAAAVAAVAATTTTTARTENREHTHVPGVHVDAALRRGHEGEEQSRVAVVVLGRPVVDAVRVRTAVVPDLGVPVPVDGDRGRPRDREGRGGRGGRVVPRRGRHGGRPEGHGLGERHGERVIARDPRREVRLVPRRHDAPGRVRVGQVGVHGVRLREDEGVRAPEQRQQLVGPAEVDADGDERQVAVELGPSLARLGLQGGQRQRLVLQGALPLPPPTPVLVLHQPADQLALAQGVDVGDHPHGPDLEDALDRRQDLGDEVGHDGLVQAQLGGARGQDKRRPHRHGRGRGRRGRRGRREEARGGPGRRGRGRGRRRRGHAHGLQFARLEQGRLQPPQQPLRRVRHGVRGGGVRVLRAEDGGGGVVVASQGASQAVRCISRGSCVRRGRGLGRDLVRRGRGRGRDRVVVARKRRRPGRVVVVVVFVARGGEVRAQPGQQPLHQVVVVVARDDAGSGAWRRGPAAQAPGRAARRRDDAASDGRGGGHRTVSAEEQGGEERRGRVHRAAAAAAATRPAWLGRRSKNRGKESEAEQGQGPKRPPSFSSVLFKFKAERGPPSVILFVDVIQIQGGSRQRKSLKSCSLCWRATGH